MFSTKREAIDWINVYADQSEITTKKRGMFWALCWSNGMVLTPAAMDNLEAIKEIISSAY